MKLTSLIVFLLYANSAYASNCSKNAEIDMKNRYEKFADSKVGIRLDMGLFNGNTATSQYNKEIYLITLELERGVMSSVYKCEGDRFKFLGTTMNSFANPGGRVALDAE